MKELKIWNPSAKQALDEAIEKYVDSVQTQNTTTFSQLLYSMEKTKKKQKLESDSPITLRNIHESLRNKKTFEEATEYVFSHQQKGLPLVTIYCLTYYAFQLDTSNRPYLSTQKTLEVCNQLLLEKFTNKYKLILQETFEPIAPEHIAPENLKRTERTDTTLAPYFSGVSFFQPAQEQPPTYDQLESSFNFQLPILEKNTELNHDEETSAFKKFKK